MAPESSLVPFCSPLSLLCGPWLPATLDMLSITMVLFFLKFHINRLLLLSVLRVIMLLGMSGFVLSFLSVLPLYTQITPCSVTEGGHLGWFLFGVIRNEVAVNIHVCVFGDVCFHFS